MVDFDIIHNNCVDPRSCVTHDCRTDVTWTVYLFDGDHGLLCVAVCGDFEEFSSLLIFDQVTHVCVLAHVSVCGDHPTHRCPDLRPF